MLWGFLVLFDFALAGWLTTSNSWWNEHINVPIPWEDGGSVNVSAFVATLTLLLLITLALRLRRQVLLGLILADIAAAVALTSHNGWWDKHVTVPWLDRSSVNVSAFVVILTLLLLVTMALRFRFQLALFRRAPSRYHNG
jgi:hypothetical protein